MEVSSCEETTKKIIIDSLQYLVTNQRVKVYAFVIMDHHFHLIWEMMHDHKREDVKRDFLKFTGQQILKHLRNTNSPILTELFVGARDPGSTRYGKEIR